MKEMGLDRPRKEHRCELDIPPWEAGSTGMQKTRTCPISSAWPVESRCLDSLGFLCKFMTVMESKLRQDLISNQLPVATCRGLQPSTFHVLYPGIFRKQLEKLSLANIVEVKFV